MQLGSESCLELKLLLIDAKKEKKYQYRDQNNLEWRSNYFFVL